MKYKVGDKVRSKVSGYVGTIDDIRKGCCIVKTGNSKVTSWPEDLVPFEGLVEEETKPLTYDELHDKAVAYANSNKLKSMEPAEVRALIQGYMDGLKEMETTDNIIKEIRDKHYWDMLGGETKNEINLPQGYQFVDENGNIINATKITLEKKKKEYPKTYEECCKVVNASPYIDLIYNVHNGHSYDYDDDNIEIYNDIRRLKICRDAYWKIAGEEMRLGKSWKPDWRDGKNKYCVYYNGKNVVCTVFSIGKCTIAFPTEEMRDEFYENFKELINSVKELL